MVGLLVCLVGVTMAIDAQLLLHSGFACIAMAVLRLGPCDEYASDRTRIEVGESCVVHLRGEWLPSDGVSDRYVVVSDSSGAFHVLAPGDWSAAAAMLVPRPGGSLVAPAPVLSPDGDAAYLWLDPRRQLLEYRFDSGQSRSLTSFPTVQGSIGDLPNPIPIPFGPSAAFAPGTDDIIIVTKTVQAADGRSAEARVKAYRVDPSGRGGRAEEAYGGGVAG